MPRRTKADDSAATTNDASAGEESAVNGTSELKAPESAPAASGVAESAKQAANQAKDSAARVLDQAKDQAASRVDEQRQTVASGIQAVAQAFQNMGNELRNQQESPVAQYAAEIGQAVGGQAERVANYLRNNELRQLVGDAEQFARRSPTVFLGSAFLLGLVASRFLKSSRPDAPAAPQPTPALAAPASTGPAQGTSAPAAGMESAGGL